MQAGLLAAAAAAGLAHGAVDHLRAERVLRPYVKRAWMALFLAGYLSLAGVVILAWVSAPGAALIAFLAASVLHFGLTDAGAAAPTAFRIERTVRVIAHGGTPVAAPCLLRPEETSAIFEALAGPAGAASVSLFGGPGAVLWAAAVLVLALMAGRAAVLPLLDIAGVFALFAAAPPLVGFAVYFAVVHSWRVMREEADDRGCGSSGFIAFGRDAAPLTLAALTATLAAYAWMVSTGSAEPTEAAIRSTFFALSALTAPHMLLSVLDRRSTALPKGSQKPFASNGQPRQPIGKPSDLSERSAFP